MSTKKIARTPKNTKTRRNERRVTLADVKRKNQATEKAEAAAKEAAYECDPRLELAIRVKRDAALLVVAVRDIVSPGPDGGGLARAMGSVARVSKRLESISAELERDVERAVAS